MRQAADALTAQQEEIVRLRRALEEIAEHPHCVYPERYGEYDTGVADGHRCAANHARRALARGETAGVPVQPEGFVG